MFFHPFFVQRPLCPSKVGWLARYIALSTAHTNIRLNSPFSINKKFSYSVYFWQLLIHLSLSISSTAAESFWIIESAEARGWSRYVLAWPKNKSYELQNAAATHSMNNSRTQWEPHFLSWLSCHMNIRKPSLKWTFMIDELLTKCRLFRETLLFGFRSHVVAT